MRRAHRCVLKPSNLFVLYGAGRGGRTPMTRRSADFESAASASSTIPALFCYCFCWATCALTASIILTTVKTPVAGSPAHSSKPFSVSHKGLAAAIESSWAVVREARWGGPSSSALSQNPSGHAAIILHDGRLQRVNQNGVQLLGQGEQHRLIDEEPLRAVWN